MFGQCITEGSLVVEVKGQNQDFSLDTSAQRERKIGFFSQSSKAQDAVKFLKQSYFSDNLVQSDPACNFFNFVDDRDPTTR